MGKVKPMLYIHVSVPALYCERRLFCEHEIYVLIISYYRHGRTLALNAVNLNPGVTAEENRHWC